MAISPKVKLQALVNIPGTQGIPGTPGPPGPQGPAGSSSGSLLSSLHPSVRISLTSGTAITTADVTGATSAFIIAMGQSATPINNGSVDIAILLPTQTTLALTPGNHLASTAYDIFEAFVAGVYVVGTGPAWANSGAGTSSRGTGAGTSEVTIFNGRRVNANVITLNNGVNTYSVGINQANLIGGFRVSVVAGTVEDSTLRRLVWNEYNAVPRKLFRGDPAVSWVWSTPSFHQANANSANQLEIFSGATGRLVSVRACGCNNSSTASNLACATGIGLNSTTVTAAALLLPSTANNLQNFNSLAFYDDYPPLGYNLLVWLEQGSGSGGTTQTWLGTVGVSWLQTGISGQTFQ
jgi:hypothetical protein